MLVLNNWRLLCFFFKQKTAYEMRISDWSSDVCSSDLPAGHKSAYFWCDKESGQHGLKGMDVFEHYLKRLSQRGWGQFRFHSHDAPNASAVIHLKNSSFVLQQPDRAGKLCSLSIGRASCRERVCPSV